MLAFRFGHSSDVLGSTAPIDGTEGTERLRITPHPHHDDGLIGTLAEALVDMWQRLQLLW